MFRRKCNVCQLFGKFLIEKEIIDRDKYKSIMERLAESRAKLGVIAVADGIITENRRMKLIIYRQQRMHDLVKSLLERVI